MYYVTVIYINLNIGYNFNVLRLVRHFLEQIDHDHHVTFIYASIPGLTYIFTVSQYLAEAMTRYVLAVF